MDTQATGIKHYTSPSKTMNPNWNIHHLTSRRYNERRRQEKNANENVYAAFLALLRGSDHLCKDAKTLMDATEFKGFSKTQSFRWSRVFLIRSYTPNKQRYDQGTTFSRKEILEESLSCNDIELNIIDVFAFFSREVYSTHPWHNHSRTLTDIHEELDEIYADLTTFCQKSFIQPHHGTKLKCKHDDISDDEVKEGIIKAAIAMHKSSKRICGLIQPMQQNYYSKAWAVEVAIRHTTITNEHWGRAIDIMIANNRIPSTSKVVLSNLIRLKLKNKFFIDDEWKGVGNNRRHGLKLAMVCFSGHVMDLYYPPKLICLSDYFGLRKGVRLYFSPRQFPTPINLLHGDCCDSFYDLRSYIIEQTKKEGEVTTTGGSPGKSVRFSCKVKQCKFYFWLKWDIDGYYIHHFRGEYDRGCIVHSNH